MTWLRAVWSLFVDRIADLLDPEDALDGDEGIPDAVPERCSTCWAWRPEDPFQWEGWEARHRTCEPVAQEVSW